MLRGVVIINLSRPLTSLIPSLEGDVLTEKNRVAYLSALMVDTRGVGIGSALTQAAIALAREHQATSIVAHAHPWN